MLCRKIIAKLCHKRNTLIHKASSNRDDANRCKLLIVNEVRNLRSLIYTSGSFSMITTFGQSDAKPLYNYLYYFLMN